MGTVAR
jgi:hypothetical protein